jgi:phosphatidyl-myo-inositol dimannoside synthase
MKVLAVVPSLHDHNPGGVQAAGEIAWRALQEHTDARLFEVASTSRLAAVAAARKVKFESDVVLFWHLDLLKLAPFLRGSGRRVVFLHGIEAWRKRGKLTRMLLTDCEVLANSNHTVLRARASIPELQGRPTRVVPLGMGRPADTITGVAPVPAAVMIGRLDSGERYKGHHEVIAAWPHVRQRIPNAQLWIVGDGDLRAELETFSASIDMGDVVRFFGRISEAEKERLVNAARCLVLPSRGEGFGLVYLEAMRAARPCLVGTDAGREVINPPEAGLAVDPADTNAIADAVTRLLSGDDEWQRMSDAARRRYEANFTAAQFQKRLITALQEMA